MIALALILLVRAVTQDDGNAPAAADRTTSTANDGSGTSTTSTTSTTLGTLAPELDAALLTLGDLPRGWIENPGTADGSLCEAQDPLLEVLPIARAERAFANEQAGLTLSNVVSEYATAAEAEGLLEAVRDAIDDCAEFETGAGEFELEAAELEDLGTEALDLHLTGDTALGEVDARVVYVRLRSRVAVLTLIGLGAVDEDIVRDAAETVVSRL